MTVNENSKPLLTVKGLKQYFKVSNNYTVHAVENVSFQIYPGETYGLVGESGSGKSTIGRSIIRLYDPTAGEINFNGMDISGRINKANSQALRTQMQMIFQDPMASLNPRKKVRDIIGEGLDIHHMYKTRAEREEKIKNILAKVGLAPEHAGRYPHQFSGGQRQRVGIARALIMNPKLIIADECISALDVSIQAQMVIDYWKEHPEMDKNGDGKLQLVYLMGDPGHTASQPRCDYLKSTIEDAGIEIDLLAEDTGMWVTATAKEKMDAWVSKYGDEIECCVAGNDAMALGALSAVEAAGFNTDGEESSKDIPIYGIDALPEILSKIESGEITGSVLQDAKTQGQTIVKMAENLTSGKDAVDGIEGVEVEEEAKAVRVPYQAIKIGRAHV